jgi:Spy/CpxP family protein refolding chaperone
MMMVRSAVFVCGLGVAAAGAAFAQDQAPPPPPAGTAMQGPPSGGRGMMDPERRAEMLKDRLGLSDSQTSQVKSILEDSRTKMETLRSNSSLSQDDRRSQMMSIRKSDNDKIEALLTPDQKTKYDAMQQQTRGRMRGGAPGGTPGGDAPPPPPPPPQS